MHWQEIVIEIASPSNTVTERLCKKALYFASSAQEVWFCDKAGALRFLNNHAEQPASGRMPDFRPASRAGRCTEGLKLRGTASAGRAQRVP